MKDDLIVIGGGIVGLATAYRYLELKREARVLVVEKEERLCAHQTGRNSGVIHSGIYYKPGSAKALNCRRGYLDLIDFCEREGVPYEICGKLIVATREEEVARLEGLLERGRANGLEGLKMLEREAFREIEPHCAGIRAIRVPQTGIVDYVAMAERMAERIREWGGEIRTGVRVMNLIAEGEGMVVLTTAGEFRADKVVNCAGLYSDRVARMTDPDLDVRITPFRGEYFELVADRQHLVKHLIYPVPDPAFPFLGVHFTRMIGGGVEAGPNAVLALGREAYSKWDVHPGELWETLAWPGFRKVTRRYWKTGMGEFWRSWWKPAFVKALQRLVPEVEGKDLRPCPAGNRAQACARDGGLLDDFHIVEHPGVLHVCNAPSPAATASLAIGRQIAERVG